MSLEAILFFASSNVLYLAAIRSCGSEYTADFLDNPKGLANEMRAVWDGYSAKDAFELAHEAILGYLQRWIPDEAEEHKGKAPSP